MSQNTDMTTQLARELASGIKESVEDLTATFKKMAIKNDRKEKKAPEFKVIKPEAPMPPEPEQATKDKQLTLFDLLAS